MPESYLLAILKQIWTQKRAAAFGRRPVPGAAEGRDHLFASEIAQKYVYGICTWTCEALWIYVCLVLFWYPPGFRSVDFQCCFIYLSTCPWVLQIFDSV